MIPTAPQRLTKAQALAHWRALGTQPSPAATMRQVAYKHRGSTFDEDGIRLTGSRAFIDSVLAALTPLLARENDRERLQLVYAESTDRDSRNPTGAWTCYIQVHERGGEAQAMNSWLTTMGVRGDR